MPLDGGAKHVRQAGRIDLRQILSQSWDVIPDLHATTVAALVSRMDIADLAYLAIVEAEDTEALLLLPATEQAL